MKLDLRIGQVHAYPNGELWFENAEDLKHDQVAVGERFQPRTLKDADDPIKMADQQISAFTRSLAGHSAYTSVRAPSSHYDAKSIRSNAKSNATMNRTADWRKAGRQNNNKEDIYSCFSKGSAYVDATPENINRAKSQAKVLSAAQSRKNYMSQS